MHYKPLIGIIAGALVLLFIVQNIAMVEIQFLFWSFSMPRAIVLLVVLAIGILIGWLWNSYLTHSKKEQ